MFLERCFYYKPIKTKHVAITNRENTEKLSLTVTFPCPVCEKAVATNHNAVCCDICDCWIHICRNNICKQTYRQPQKDPSPWCCKSCLKKEIPI